LRGGFAGPFGGDLAKLHRQHLNGSRSKGHRYLTPAAVKFLTTPQTGDLPTGFSQNDTFGNHGANFGWGIATCVVRTSHDGVAAMLSPGSFGHGRAWGTQAWIDLVKGVAYVLMGQLSIDSPDIRELSVRAEVLVLSSVLI